MVAEEGNNVTGNPGMATGGTGDVLTGVITGLIAQGLDPLSAAQLGTHVHGVAGDLACKARRRSGHDCQRSAAFFPEAFLAM